MVHETRLFLTLPIFLQNLQRRGTIKVIINIYYHCSLSDLRHDKYIIKCGYALELFSGAY